MKWISINDRLPLKQEDVNYYASVKVIVATSRREVLVMGFQMGNTITPWHKFGDFSNNVEVTHWMPLPPPPESKVKG